MERETGIEPATSSLGSWRSTAELLPLDLVRLPFRFVQDKRNPRQANETEIAVGSQNWPYDLAFTCGGVFQIRGKDLYGQL